MTKASAASVASLLAMTALAGCSSEPGPTIEVESDIALCAPGGPCVSLPAAGALYVVDRDGERVADGTLSRAGRAVVEAGPGTYSVTVTMVDLGVQESSDDVEQGPEPQASTTVQVQLASVTVANEDAR